MQIKLRVHIRRCNGNSVQEESYYENVELSGYFRKWVNQSETDSCVSDDEDRSLWARGCLVRDILTGSDATLQNDV